MADETRMDGRLRLLHPGDLDDSGLALRETFETAWMPWADATPFAARGPDGTYIGPFNPLLHSPTIAAAFLRLQVAEGEHSMLGERVRQVVILSIGAVWRSDYEVYAHVAAAVKAGFAHADAVLLGRGEPCDVLSEQEALAQRVALEMARMHRIPRALYEAAERTFTPRGLVDLTILAGCYLSICFLLNLFEIPAPADAAS